MKRNQRLSILTTQKSINDELDVTCSFMDIMIHDWSDEQAEAMFLNLTGKNQMEISQMLGISQPAVNRRLKAAHFDTIHKFINRFENLLKKPES
jgi:predicted HNH restriction endonuclease